VRSVIARLEGWNAGMAGAPLNSLRLALLPAGSVAISGMKISIIRLFSIEMVLFLLWLILVIFQVSQHSVWRDEVRRGSSRCPRLVNK
jgi:hypothetical protein